MFKCAAYTHLYIKSENIDELTRMIEGTEIVVGKRISSTEKP